MTSSDFHLTVLGTRGSMAIGGPAFSEFGGNTSCYMVRAGEETLFLDAGSGLLAAPDEYAKPPVILLSHLHLDHVMGLGMFSALSKRGQKVILYVPFCADAEEARSEIDRLFSPPFWPLKLSQMGAELQIRPLPSSIQIGDLTVETMCGNHPGGCIVYKLCYQGKSFVYATDFEHGGACDEALAAFSRDTDLLLYDAQFEQEEHQKKKGYGHSTAEKGLALMERAGIGRLLLIHHDPRSTDPVLRQRERELNTERVSYAREGQIIFL